MKYHDEVQKLLIVDIFDFDEMQKLLVVLVNEKDQHLERWLMDKLVLHLVDTMVYR
jgi:hypothetical protein